MRAQYCVECGSFVIEDKQAENLPNDLACPDCGCDYFYEKEKRFLQQDVKIVATGRLEIHDLAAIVATMQQDLNDYSHITDAWVETACNLMELFFQTHRQELPLEPFDVWRENEVEYFILAFILWSAQTKYKLFNDKTFRKCVASYHARIKSLFEGVNDTPFDNDSVMDFSTYLEREREYVSLLVGGSTSFLRLFSGSMLKPVCKQFVDRACKRYVYSHRDLVKITSHWFMENHLNLQKNFPSKLQAGI